MIVAEATGRRMAKMMENFMMLDSRGRAGCEGLGQGKF